MIRRWPCVTRAGGASVLIPTVRHSATSVATTTTAEGAGTAAAGSADSTTKHPAPQPTAVVIVRKTGAAAKSPNTAGFDYSSLKTKRRGPWGKQQLRDSWSDDAMRIRDTDKISHRMTSKMRYHPDEFKRKFIKWIFWGTLTAIFGGLNAGTYMATGDHFFASDKQIFLNVSRAWDTSPRSHLYYGRLVHTRGVPEHVQRYRERQRKHLEEQAALDGLEIREN